jgi:hypothetical protein
VIGLDVQMNPRIMSLAAHQNNVYLGLARTEPQLVGSMCTWAQHVAESKDVKYGSSPDLYVL